MIAFPAHLRNHLSLVPPRFRLTVFAMAIGFLVIPHLGIAQNQVGAEAVLVSKRIPVGEQTALVLRIINGKPESLPDRIEVDGLEIARSNRVEQKFGFGTGGNLSEYQFYYYVSTSRAGEFEIPALRLRVEGVELTTKPLSLTVYQRDPSDPGLDATRPYFANLAAPSVTVYAGQMSPFDLSIYVRGARSINDMGPPSLRHDAVVIDFERTYKLDAVELDGITFTTAKRSGSFFGLTPGAYTLGPAELQVAMIDDSSPFGRMPGFFQSFVAKTLRSNPLEVTVKPLPETGKPPTFRGAVGNFDLAVKASPLSVSVGDPISLDFEVTGPGNYETLQAPALPPAEAANWRTYDARKIVDPTEISDGATSGRATFTQIVMPQAELTEIPSFELPFFNPTTGVYEIQKTEPIRITVTPDTRTPSAAPAGVAISGAGVDAAPPGTIAVESAATPKPTFDDIVHIRTTSPHWRKIPVAVTSLPLFWVGQIVPLLGLGALVGFAVARHHKARQRQRRKKATMPYRSALAAVSEATGNRHEFYRSVNHALDCWIGEAGTNGERNLPENIKAALDALRSRCQWVVYGASESEQGRTPDPQEVSECRQILLALERQGR